MENITDSKVAINNPVISDLEEEDFSDFEEWQPSLLQPFLEEYWRVRGVKMP